ncbi:MAG: hypothetical protein GY838_14130 [bacterium]|nr:hypothetical protein [bacterium]
MASPARLSFVLLAVCLVTPLAAVAVAPPTEATPVAVLGVDHVGGTSGLAPAEDLLSLTLYRDAAGDPWLRVGLLSLDSDDATARALGRPREDFAAAAALRVESAGRLLGAATLERRDAGYRALPDKAGAAAPVRRGDGLWLPLDRSLVDGATAQAPLSLEITTAPGETMRVRWPAAAPAAYLANCALVLHGNQGLGYTDVFHGRSDDLEGSGFDEAMQIHEATSVPGNFHLSGTLMTAAEWSANTGDPQDFNAWLTAGVTAGWAGMLTSAFGQHMMPFVQDDMNDWSVNIETQMVNTRYGYFPTVAWVPERVWLNTSGYPSSGVSDWIGDNWQSHGVNGVILDDSPHLSGHDNHQIHTLSGTGLRLIPRDRDFTGNIIGGNGQAALDVLTGLASSGLGEFRIVVMAEDWEAVAEMGGWATATPNARETYDWFVQKCADESAWLSTWKLADALSHADFNGDTFTPTPGTYNEIGGGDGYGGGDNGWYTDWAGYVPYANGGDGGACAGTGGNCKNYGTLWNDAYTALMAAPDNTISQAGWYVLMTNLHETAWHDGLGGAISGWQHKYSAHMKNAMVYAEAAHWANGEYGTTTAAYLADLDNDGYDEVVLHNDRLFAVFESNGGRCTWLFTKNGLVNDTAIGVDNAYWFGTDADFNDGNHVGGFSDVSPDYQHLGYGVEIVSASGATATIRLLHDEVVKEISLTTGEPWLDTAYSVGQADHWLQAGFSPSLVDLVWNAQMDRVWVGDQAYMGQRNPNTGQTVAWILGTGGASHQKEISGTLMKGDELFGNAVFQVRLYAGATSAPDGLGEIAELRTCATGLVDTRGPVAAAAEYIPGTDRLRVTFDQPADALSADVTAFALDENGDGSADVTLGLGSSIVETGVVWTLTFQLDAADAAAVEALDPVNLLLLATAGAVDDENGVGSPAVTEVDDVQVVQVTTAITVDGHIEAGDWTPGFNLDDAGDSAWTSSNEIEALHCTWDDIYLYVAVEGRVDGNSWLLYLDVDPGTANGETDLTAIDAWERGASFTAAGFAADFEYGCYQHQSTFDGDGFWQLLSPTTTQDRSGEIQSAYDSFHVYGDDGGSELAIPWHTLYGLGEGTVPSGAQISLVAAITWDPEPDGELGGDSAPDNFSATLPVLDRVWTLDVDINNDGLPDDLSVSDVPGDDTLVRLALRRVAAGTGETTFAFDLPGTVPLRTQLHIYDLRGHRVSTLVNGSLPAGSHRRTWTGRDDVGRRVASGLYLVRLSAGGQAVTCKVAILK